MTRTTLMQRNLAWYWRTNLAVVAGVAVAVSVLAGALLVGDSVRASLRRLALERLGETGAVVTGPTWVRETLAEDLVQASTLVRAAVPLIAIDAVVTHAASGRRAGPIQVFGVDDRFWQFHGRTATRAPAGREALASPSLAEELGATAGDALLLRVQKPSAIPAGVLQGRRDETSRAVRVTLREVLLASALGEFSVVPGQGPVRAVFVPLRRLQQDLDRPDRVNAVLVSGARQDTEEFAAVIDQALADAATPADLGVKLLVGEEAGAVAGSRQPALIVESETGLLDARLQRTVQEEARRLGYRPLPVLTYLANSIRVGEREIPYSVISALDIDSYFVGDAAAARSSGAPTQADGVSPIWLNEWAARELAAAPGARVDLEYYLWSDERGLETRSAAFTLAGIVPMSGAGGDRTLTPEYPGITDALRIGDWDPPFPVDLGRIRPQDERYWDEFRAAPKAFVPLAAGQRQWPSPFGSLTSIRVYPPGDVPLETARLRMTERLAHSWTPAAAGLTAHPVRVRALAAAQGTTDFGEYFVYFSFFLVVSGLLLTALFFKLGVEQRAREVGLLQAVGFTVRDVRRLMLGEGAVLSVMGSLLGMAGAVGFSGLILLGLGTWWVDAVGTRALELYIAPLSLLAGAGGGVLMATAAIWWTLRGLSRATARRLMGGAVTATDPALVTADGTRAFLQRATAPVTAVLLAVLLLGAGWLALISVAAAFFGAGLLLLLALLLAFAAWLRRPALATIHEPGMLGVARLGARQTTWRPGRSVLSVALIASATFMIVSVGAFRRTIGPELDSPSSGTGGFRLYAESLVPLMHDPATAAGRASLGFSTADESWLAEARIARFRLRPGDEGSCLNLYRPTSPRIVAPTDEFRRRGGFTFATTMAADDRERQNPWLLLDRVFDDGAVPVIGDANSLAYALHRRVGEDFAIAGPDGAPVTLRVVAALSDSIFQSELIVSERDFVRLFPRHEGYRFFLLAPPRGRDANLAAVFEDRLADFGFDAMSTADRLASYHRVENTYISTFQTLGGLGLVLGTLGLGTVLLRNVLERRRELALLRAVGYRGSHLSVMVLTESLILLLCGLAGGALAALVAIAPAFIERGGALPLASTLGLLLAVLGAGLLSTVWATRAAATAPLLQALRSE